MKQLSALASGLRIIRNRLVRREPILSGIVKAFIILRNDGFAVLSEQLADRTHISYARWIERYEQPDSFSPLADGPLLSVLMPVFNPLPEHLLAAIASVLAQSYQNWELCIADDASTDPKVIRAVDHAAQNDRRIRVVHRKQNGHISKATNSALEISTGEWIVLFDHDDLLSPNALNEVAACVVSNPSARIIYTDEDKIDRDGVRVNPFFKPDYSPELIRSMNYFNHLTAFRRQDVIEVGGWRDGFEGSQDYDIVLRIVERLNPSEILHVPKVLYHWRVTESSTATSSDAKPYAYAAGVKALREHTKRIGLPALVDETEDYYRVRPLPQTPSPQVSIIIPTKDGADLLYRCVTSILEKTRYENYQIVIIDNGSTKQDTLDLFVEYNKSPKITVLEYDGPFNYSAINNFAVSTVSSDVVALVNNDIEVISEYWLNEMAGWAMMPGIGCVGAKLYYPDDTIQHGGVIVGLGGVAGHSHKHYPREAPGYFHRLKVVQNLSAVTAACLAVRRSIYLEVGGLNERDLAVAFNDVDFCLRVHAAGWRNVWTPFAELYHHESATRGEDNDPVKAARFAKEIDYMKATWGGYRDPYYSPNLTLNREDFSIG